MSRFNIVLLIGCILAVVALRVGTSAPALNRQSLADATAWTEAAIWRSEDRNKSEDPVEVGVEDQFVLAHAIEVDDEIDFANEFGDVNEIQIREPVKFDNAIEFQNVLLPIQPFRFPQVAAESPVSAPATIATATVGAAHDPGQKNDTNDAVNAVPARGPGETAEPSEGESKGGSEGGMPEPIRGLFLSGWAAGERLPETVAYMLQHDLNTIVIDIKDTDGLLSFAMPGTTAHGLGANARKMGGPERVRQTLRDLKRQGIYVIGRLALFQDNFLPHRRPDWALRTIDGELWQDAKGGYWLDPTRPELLDYHVEIAVAAAVLGFDEIQFDYVRYPGQRVPGYNDGTAQQRIATITRFATTARRRIQEQVDVPVSGAIYGIVAVNQADHHLGQDLNALTEALDYVSPMFYPSHYLPGDFGSPDPNAEPYRTLFASTAAALARTNESDWTKLRPWIQSFFGYQREQVEEQIRAIKDLGVDSFLVWNPNGRYIGGVDYHLSDEGESRLADSPFRQVIYPLMSPATGIFVVDPAFKFPAYPAPVYAGDNGPGWHVQATRHPGGYRLELWQERSQRAVTEGSAHDAAAREGRAVRRSHGHHDSGTRRRVVAVQRSTARVAGQPLVAKDRQTFGREEDGITLTWVEQDYEWYVWAPSFSEVLAAKQSLQTLPSPLF